MQQVAVESNLLKENGTVSLTRLECEYGMESFLPMILLENVKIREIRKHIRYFLKRDSAKLSESLAKQAARGDSNQPLFSLRVTDAPVSLRVRYLELLSHLPSFCGRGFSVTFKESQIDMIIQVDPRTGLLVRHPGKTNRPTISIDFDLIDRLVVRRDSDITSLISFRMASSPEQGLEFLVDKDDIDDLVSYICGYQLVQSNRQLICDFDDTPPTTIKSTTDPPPYSAVHKVIPCEWNYTGRISTFNRSLDLTIDPPPYELSNSFASAHSKDKTDTESETRPRSPSPLQPNSNAVRKSILHATDSMLIKNSQKLQRKEVVSPLIPRLAHRMESISDSSDFDESSLNSPLRSPVLDDEMALLLDRSQENIGYDSNRRESIETLISSVHAQHVPNLESLILFYQDTNGVSSTKNDQGETTKVADTNECENVANEILSPMSKTTVAPMASIEEEMSISQITAAS
ncbi:hypothetical protein KIN20_016330 [Parelaphostrongylus tenuis]|uniref:FERM domain-containing protein n=1 Tax=Parelaphostrongylus tenuis TaxID=148309 RepID=A0AAD5MJU9_PARTN|nr:hypothetical protein KIN20_016330 [Parelaphostrongylus tenuis]